MYDYRIKKIDPQTNETVGRRNIVLEPILENQEAHIAHLKKPTSEYLKLPIQRK
jgi:hypothetical protein